MAGHPSSLIPGLMAFAVSAADYDFSAVDTLLSDSLARVFKGGVVCMAGKHGTGTWPVPNAMRHSEYFIGATTDARGIIRAVLVQ